MARTISAGVLVLFGLCVLSAVNGQLVGKCGIKHDVQE